MALPLCALERFAYLSAMILVTGGTGLVGAHLLWQLIASGEKVRATYRSEQSKVAVEELFRYKAKNENEVLQAQSFFQKLNGYKQT